MIQGAQRRRTALGCSPFDMDVASEGQQHAVASSVIVHNGSITNSSGSIVTVHGRSHARRDQFYIFLHEEFSDILNKN
jgi:hypothetical protein